MFKAIFFDPLYNSLVFISAHVPGSDLGVAIITLTIIVKLILLPLYHQSLVTQIKLKKIEPEIKKIKDNNKNNKTEETKQLLNLYKENKINPLIGFVVILIQIPIVIALFYVFKDSGSLQGANHFFLGFLDVTKRSLGAAFLTGLTQFIQIKLSLPALPAPNSERTMKDDLIRSMHFQMKYFMPVILMIVATGLPAAISLYWVTGNIFSIIYEVLIRRKMMVKI